MKKTLKKACHGRYVLSYLLTVGVLRTSINNTEYTPLDASTGFMKTVFVPFSGIVTDRICGAGEDARTGPAPVARPLSLRAILCGNATHNTGSILIAVEMTVYNHKFMTFGTVVQAHGFAPSDGFTSILGLELEATANIIGERTGDFSWVYWTSVFTNRFVNLATFAFWSPVFHASDVIAPAAFLVYHCPHCVQDVVDSRAKPQYLFCRSWWYCAVSQYLFLLISCLGIFTDIRRLSEHQDSVRRRNVFAIYFARWGLTVAGTAASSGIYAFVETMWYQGVFGSSYAFKFAVNNGLSIIVRVVVGLVQDHDSDGSNDVIGVYAFLATRSPFVRPTLPVAGCFSVDLGRLQWTKQRLFNGELISEQREV
ncbi:hypothetical protein K488DRAFT_78274 [Vararia minispora EC-137]|uniref:Uncharacterized protein n=1 Tax=Vararia minispora EC-137 TaxID=1314806 RepID=A0ACB8QMB5_9AGAM|nr:hypothetical protein K488DRAFT_78274 [Vararia minispora EC-137]